MGEDFSEVLGLEEGTRVRFTLLSRPDNAERRVKVGAMIDGYLSKTAMLGEPLQLQGTNDPMNPGRIISVSGWDRKSVCNPARHCWKGRKR